MRKKKRYGGLILLLAIFLAFRPASALCVHAAETGRDTGHYASDGETSEKKSKKKFELPQVIKDYHFDADAEKKRLAEAISKLDELGFSPEKMAERFWTIISRKENREKIGKAAEDLKENTGKLIEKASGAGTDSAFGKDKSDQADSGEKDSGKGESPEDKSTGDKSVEDKSIEEKSRKDDSEKKGSKTEGSGKTDPEDSQSGKDSGVKVRKSEDAPLYERAVDGVDRVKEKVREEASKKVEEAIDQAAEAAADYAVKEINETAEKVKEEVR